MTQLELVPLLPVELAPIQRRYISGFLFPTLTDLDLELRLGSRAVGVKIEDEPVAFALIQASPPPPFPGPLLVTIGAPDQSSDEQRRFFREVVKRHNVQAIWGRSDDVVLLETLLMEKWTLESMGPFLVLERAVSRDLPEGVECRHLLPADFLLVQNFLSATPDRPKEIQDDDDLKKWLQDRLLDGVFEHDKLRALSLLVPQHHPSYVTIRILVDPAYRKQGFGQMLSAEVASGELRAGRTVVAAFRSEETVARRLVESVGSKVAALYFLARPPKE